MKISSTPLEILKDSLLYFGASVPGGFYKNLCVTHKKFLTGSTFIVILLMASVVFGEESFKYDPKGKRDPFVPLVSEGGVHISDVYGVGSIKDIRLEGIVWDDKGGSVAIINSEIVKEGEVLGVLKVLKIEKDGVIFDVNGEEVKLDLTSDY